VRLVVDASVAVKWFLREQPNLVEAAAVVAAIEHRDTKLFAPPHWVIEVVSVLVRL
jgi:predicted nucleic acid-binding protein